MRRPVGWKKPRGDELVCSAGHWKPEVGEVTLADGTKQCRECRRQYQQDLKWRQKQRKQRPDD